MSTYKAFSSLLLFATLLSLTSSVPTNTSLINQDLAIAIEEMKRANYFTFVMLLNIVLPNLIKPNITFLMPRDKALAKTLFPDNNISDFLLRHTIPSPLLFDHLVHIPTGSMIPTSKPDQMVKISNNGRRSFYLSNVRLISPNLCTAGYSIRCHGIDGVLEPTFSSPSCSINSSSSIAPPPMPAPPACGGVPVPPPLAVPPISGGGQAHLDSPLPPYHHEDPKLSGSSHAKGLSRFWPVVLGLVIGLAMLFCLVLI